MDSLVQDDNIANIVTSQPSVASPQPLEITSPALTTPPNSLSPTTPSATCSTILPETTTPDEPITDQAPVPASSPTIPLLGPVTTVPVDESPAQDVSSTSVLVSVHASSSPVPSTILVLSNDDPVDTGGQRKSFREVAPAVFTVVGLLVTGLLIYGLCFLKGRAQRRKATKVEDEENALYTLHRPSDFIAPSPIAYPLAAVVSSDDGEESPPPSPDATLGHYSHWCEAGPYYGEAPKLVQFKPVAKRSARKPWNTHQRGIPISPLDAFIEKLLAENSRQGSSPFCTLARLTSQLQA